MLEHIVLVRAYDQEALRRVVISVEKGLVYCAAENSLVRVTLGESDAVGFPAADVFCFKSELYEKLSNEVSPERRESYWREATPFQNKDASLASRG